MTGKRGQTALEFLTTYGWALILVVMTIAVMVYLGVVNPQLLKPDMCRFPAESGIRCTHASAGTDGNLHLTVQNIDNGEIMLEDIACIYEGSGVMITRNIMLDGLPFIPSSLHEGEKAELTCSFGGDNPFAGRVGKQVAVEADVTLASEARTTGRIRVTVEG